MDILFILLGLGFLFFGGEWLVRGSVSIAERFGLSTLLVSLVIVGFGTSAPELLVSVQAALSGAPDLALGNVIGSNTANILLILGIAAVIKPIATNNFTIRRDSIAVICASLLLAGLSYFEVISRISGAFMLVALISYLYMAYRLEKAASPAEMIQSKDMQAHIIEDAAPDHGKVGKSALLVVVGLVMLVVGAHMLVTGASAIARSFGVSEAIIGLSLVALGTSLPELVTAVIASLKGHSDVVIGNVLGSNLFNILGILGVTALLMPLSFTGRLAEVDIWLMLACAVILYPVIRSGHVISRLEGCIFLALYAGYVGLMFVA